MLLLIGTVFSAAQLYSAKGQTRSVIRDTDRLERKARQLRSELAALDVEWAYLNSPENLNRLVDLYSDELQLKERDPDKFARLSELPIRGAGIEAESLPQDRE